MSHLDNFIKEIRFFMYGGMITLPLTIGGTMTILGLFTANYAMLFFLLGFLIITPILSYICNIIFIAFSSLFNTTNGTNGTHESNPIKNMFNKQSYDICGLSIPYKTNVSQSDQEFVASSTWIAMMSFFIGYIFKNAIELYNRESPDVEINSDVHSDINSKVNNRKFQSIVSIMSIILFAITVIGYRLYTKCESKVAVIISSLLFIPLGFGWYKALASVGQDRLSDLFGIANRLLSPTADEPVACIPSK
jgi:hypothetical protein